jgi:hypothetical protein
MELGVGDAVPLFAQITHQIFAFPPSMCVVQAEEGGR